MKIFAGIFFGFMTIGAWDQGDFVLAVVLGLIAVAAFISARPKKQEWEHIGKGDIYGPKK